MLRASRCSVAVVALFSCARVVAAPTRDVARAPEAAARQLVVRVDQGVAAVEPELTLDFTRRLTFILPDVVRLVVVGSPDVLVAHARENVVVVSLIESDYVRQRRPVTNLTILLTDGTTVSARIRPAESAQAVTVDAVQVERGSAFEGAVFEQALRLVETWAQEPGDRQDERVAQGIDTLVLRRARQELARAAAEELVAVPVRGRTKRSFIYLSAEGGVRLGAWAVLRLSLRNESQPTFTVGRVRVAGANIEVPPERLVVEVPDRTILADGRVRPLAIVGPWAELSRWPLVVTVCAADAAERCVELEVEGP